MSGSIVNGHQVKPLVIRASIWYSVYSVIIYGFLYLPMGLLIIHSFNASKYSLHWDGWTLEWYKNLIMDDNLISSALHSLTVATLAATCATVLGTIGAWSQFRYTPLWPKFSNALLFVTLMSPDIVMGVSLLVLFIVLQIPLGLGSLLLAHITFCLPFVMVTIRSRLSGFDLSLLEAAQDLGATEKKAFWYILFPLILPAVIAGWLLSFTLSLDDVVVSFFVTGPTFEVLPLRIYSMVRLGVKPEVNALATLLFIVSLFFVSLSQIALNYKK